MIRGRVVSEAVLLGATIVCLLPGFALPFAAAIALPPASADLLLLGCGITALFNSVVGLAVEANTVAEYGRAPVRVASGLRRCCFRRYLRNVVVTATLIVAAISPVLAWLYSRNLSSKSVWVVLVPFACSGLLSVISAIFSGIVAARGHTTVSLSTQGIRTLPPLIGMIIIDSSSVLLLAWLLMLGEFMRALMLAVVGLRTDDQTPSDVGDHGWTFGGTVWQMLSTSASQASPAVDRWFLTIGGNNGYVTTYEISDKVYYGGFQLVVSGLLLSRFARWKNLLARGRGAARELIRKDLRDIAVTGLALAPVLAACAYAFAAAPILPQGWVHGLQWSIIAVVGLPFGLCQTLLARVIVALREQAKLLPLTLVSVTSNVVMNVVWFNAMGAIGIVVSSLCTRIIVFVVYLVVVSRALAGIPELSDGQNQILV